MSKRALTAVRVAIVTAIALKGGTPGFGQETGLKLGDTVPGPFQVLMATGPRAGMFHAPICDFDLNPGVVVFVREAALASKPLDELIKGLDAAISQHPQARLAAYVVLLNDGGYRSAIEAPLEDKKVTDTSLTTATLAKEAIDAQ